MSDEAVYTDLARLGYSAYYGSIDTESELAGDFVARVVAEHKGVYRIIGSHGEYAARITGRHNYLAVSREDYPAVGDWVIATGHDPEQAIIKEILPRKTVLKRRYSGKNDVQIIATNIEVAFIVESVGRDFNLNRYERYVVLAQEGGITPVLILNKIDVIPEDEASELLSRLQARFPGVETVATSAMTRFGIEKVRSFIEKGKTCCFIGSSGVGKSSLINVLRGREDILTQEIGEGTGRGKHTTTARQLYILENGGILIDNPGTREVGVADASSGIETAFKDISHLEGSCKFPDCTHIHEPGCAVLKAVEDGVIEDGQYQNFLKLNKENRFYAMSPLEKRQKDKKFGKLIKKVLDQQDD